MQPKQEKTNRRPTVEETRTNVAERDNAGNPTFCPSLQNALINKMIWVVCVSPDVEAKAQAQRCETPIPHPDGGLITTSGLWCSHMFQWGLAFGYCKKTPVLAQQEDAPEVVAHNSRGLGMKSIKRLKCHVRVERKVWPWVRSSGSEEEDLLLFFWSLRSTHWIFRRKTGQTGKMSPTFFCTESNSFNLVNFPWNDSTKPWKVLLHKSKH